MKTLTIKNILEQDLDYFKKLSETNGFTSSKTLSKLIETHQEYQKTNELSAANQQIEGVLKEKMAQIESLQSELTEVNTRLQEVSDIKNQLNLKLRPEVKEYFLNISIVAKRDGYANSPEELFENMLKVFHKRGEFLLDQNDLDFINQQKQTQNAN